MLTGKLYLDLAVSLDGPGRYETGTGRNLDRRKARRFRRSLRRFRSKPRITHPVEDQIGVQPIEPRDMRNRYIRCRRLNTDRRSALRSNRWRLRLTSSPVRSRFVRRTTLSPIVSAIQSGHYPTHTIPGRAAKPDAYNGTNASEFAVATNNTGPAIAGPVLFVHQNGLFQS